MVGVTGFEPVTPCPPDKCATKLRYTPTLDLMFYTTLALGDADIWLLYYLPYTENQHINLLINLFADNISIYSLFDIKLI